MKKEFRKPSFIDLSLGKVPPQAVEYEEKLIAGILYDSDILSKIVTILKPENFYKEDYKLIYTEILEMFSKDIPINEIIVSKRMKDKGIEDIPMSVNARMISFNEIEYYALIIYQKYLQREIIRISSEYTKKSFDESEDVFQILKSMEKEINDLWTPINNMKKKTSIDVARIISSSINDESEEDSQKLDSYSRVLYTGMERFDQKVETVPNKIVLVSGAAGDGKTKFVSYWMYQILKRYHDIVSVKWISLEDSAEDIATNFFSANSIMTIKQIKRKKYNPHQKKYILQMIDTFKKFDISYDEQSKYLDDHIKDFLSFIQKRPQRFNILIIDNILSLRDRDSYGINLNAMYDYSMNKILEAKQKTGALIIVVHHYNDAQQAKMNLKTAYRPTLTDIKGTEAFRRVPNQVLMINYPGKRKDLLDEYYGEKKEILKNMFIIDPGKIRDDDNTDDSSLLYLYADLGYCIFYEIPSIIK